MFVLTTGVAPRARALAQLGRVGAGGPGGGRPRGGAPGSPAYPLPGTLASGLTDKEQATGAPVPSERSTMRHAFGAKKLQEPLRIGPALASGTDCSVRTAMTARALRVTVLIGYGS